jgi:hypothetical protein
MINIAELLRNAPKGLKLYSPLFGEVEFAEVMDTDYVPIRVMKCGYGLRFDEYGRYMGNEYPDSECLLFPSKDCRTWEWWKLPVEPKFKVGDKVIYGGKERTIIFMDDKFYDFDGGCAGCRIELQDGLLRPAPKPHYNIGNFHAGMPVLVRADNVCRWDYSVFSRITGNKDWQFAVCNGVMFTQCIPFNKDTEHLLGTNDMCDEQYINW